MKQFKTILIFFAAMLVVLIVGLVVFLKTLDVNRFKDRITLQMSKSIGRAVTMEHVAFKFSLAQGVTLHLSGLTLMDHPDFSPDPALYVDSCHLIIDIASLLSKRQILISKIEMDSLSVHLIRNSTGEFNFEKFAKQDSVKTDVNKDASTDPANQDSAQRQAEKSGDIAFGDMLIRSILVSDGTFIFTDHMLSPALTVPVTRIEIEITNVALDARFPFSASASLWSGQKNIQASGLAEFNVKNRQARIDDLNIKSDMSQLSLDRLYKGFPPLKEAGLQGPLGGQLTVTVLQMILGEQGLLVLSSEGRLTGGTLRVKDSPVPVKNLEIHFELSESNMQIKKFTMPLASGELNMSGQILDYLKEQKFVGDLNIKDVQIKELTAGMDLPAKVEGKLNGSFKGSGTGLASEALRSSLAAEGVIEVMEGRVIDVNILKLVLSQLSAAANIVDSIFGPILTKAGSPLRDLEAGLSERYKEKLKSKDTLLKKVKIDTRIQSGALMINRAEVNADEFLFIARGKLTFEQHFNLEADFYIPEELSAGLVEISEELKYFLNERKQIHIPFKPYNGKFANFKMLYPDVKDIGKEAIKNRGQEELKKVIFKALELEDKQPPGQAPEGGETAPKQEGGKREKEAIENILNTIFK